MAGPVFISHSSRDVKVARGICDAIESRGFACWISGRDVGPGEHYGDAIVEAIERAQAMVLVFSSAANNSEEIKKELALASQHRVTVIPVRVEDIAPSQAFRYELATRQWIDMFVDWDQALKRLTDKIAAIQGVDAPVRSMTPAAPAPQPPEAKATGSGRSALLAGIAVAIVAVIAVGGIFWARSGAGGESQRNPTLAGQTASVASAGAAPAASAPVVSPPAAPQAAASAPVLATAAPAAPNNPAEPASAGAAAASSSAQRQIEAPPPMAPAKPASSADPLKAPPVAADAGAPKLALEPAPAPVVNVALSTPAEILAPKPATNAAPSPPAAIDPGAPVAADAAKASPPVVVASLGNGAEAQKKPPAKNDGVKSFKDCEECPEMVVAPSGAALIGSPPQETARLPQEAPPQEVVIPKPFAVGRYDVSFDEWDACVADGGCNNRRPGDYGWGRGRQPVILVSWNDAQSYLAWLRKKTGKPYRLLSETEWEYAARGCAAAACPNQPFWFGAITPEIANYDARYAYLGSPKGLGRGRAIPVDEGPPNPFGLTNMLGNVRQWVEDCWSPEPGPPPPAGAPRLDGDCAERVTRGGSYSDKPQELRAAARSWETAETRSQKIGFRVARALDP